MSKQFEGITLLFHEDRADGEYAVLLSYSISCATSAEATRIAHAIAEEVVATADVPTEYVGLADVFSVSGPAAPGAVLGRTHFPEWQSAEDVHRARKQVDASTLVKENDKGLKNYIAVLGFLGRLANGEVIGLSAQTLVLAISVMDAETQAAKIAISTEFKKVVTSLGYRTAEQLEFISVLSIARADDDALNGGSFQDMICRLDDANEEWSMEDELLHPEDLIEHFEEDKF